AFEDCSSLKAIKIPSGVTKLESIVFDNCTSLTDIQLPNSITEIEYHAFYNTRYYNRTAHWDNGLLYIGTYLVNAKTSLAGDVVVRDGTTVIADSAFNSCTAITSITIPSSVTVIGKRGTFNYCDALRRIDVAEDNPSYCSEGGVLLTKDKTRILHVPAQKSVLVTVKFVDAVGNSLMPSDQFFSKPHNTFSYTVPTVVGYKTDETVITGTVGFDDLTITIVYFEETTVANGTAGDAITWIFYKDGQLVFNGRGDIPDYARGNAPWSAYADRITSIHLDSRITAVGANAFADLTALTHVEFGHGITVIGESAFAGASSLASVSFPASLLTIGDNAFNGCAALTTVVIPDSVKTIGDDAFADSHAITTVTVGNAVEQIGANAFDSATLTTVRFRGKPASLGANAFGSTAGKWIYYYSHIEGWATAVTGGTWNGYAAAPYDIATKEQFDGGELYAIKVVDKHNTPLDNATVILGDQSFTTGADGIAYFTRPYTTVSLSVMRQDHNPFENACYVARTERNIDLIELSDSPSTVQGVSCDGESIATSVHILNSNSGEKTTITVSGYSKYAITRYELLQGSRLIAAIDTAASTATFTVKASAFEEGETVVVKMFTADDSHVAAALNINVLHIADLATESIFDSFAQTSIFFKYPPFGTFQLPLTLEPLNGQQIYTAVDGNTIRVGINCDFSKFAKDERKDLFKSRVQREIQNSLKSFAKDDSGFGCDLAGYLEIQYLGNDQYRVETCYVKLATSVQLGFKAQASFYGIVGVYFKVSLKGEGSIDLTITDFNLEDGFVIDDANFTLVDTLRLEGGAYLLWGAGKAGVYGQVEMGFTLGLAPRFELEEVWISGQYGVTYSVLWGWIRGSVPLGQGDIYRWKNANAADIYNIIDIAALEAMQNPDTYEFNDRSYLENRSPWLSGVSTFSLRNDEPSYLQANTYYNVAPKAVTVGDTTVMVWLDDNEERDDDNYQTLYYSVYDKESDVWSEPQQLDRNDTFDCEFDLVTDGDKIYVLYTEQNTLRSGVSDLDIEDSDAIAALISGTEVAFAVFENGAFSEPVRLTDNDDCETLPTLTVDGDDVIALWTTVEGMDYTSQVTSSTVIARTLRDGVWSAPVIVTEDQAQISSVTAARLDGVLSTVFVLDADNNTFTESDKALIAYTEDGRAVTIAQGGITDVSAATINGVSMLVWNQDGIIYATRSLDEAPVALSAPTVVAAGDYTIVSVSDEQTMLTYITQNSDSETSTDIYGNFIDENGAVSAAVALTETSGTVDHYTVTVIDGELMIVFTEAFADVQEDRVETETYLRYDLYNFGMDVVVVETSFDVAEVAQNGTLHTAVTLANAGAVDVNTVTVTLYDPQDNAVFSVDLDVLIKAGERTTLDLDILLPASLVGGAYTLEVIPHLPMQPFARGDQSADTDLSDNRTEMIFGYSDFSLTTEQTVIGGKNYILLTVYNNGNTAASAVINVTVDGVDGPISVINVGTLQAGGNAVYYVDADSITDAAHPVVTFTATVDGYDPFEINNSALQLLFVSDNDALTTDPDEVIVNPALSDTAAAFDRYTHGDITV
ncbi:MAG: leucine-rich repeat protein, partial [Clostridia bacterium]|nr:leucine-rich repeat protein [Clostridia bacterium]